MVQMSLRKLLEGHVRRVPVHGIAPLTLLRGKEALLARVEWVVEEIRSHGVKVDQTRVRRTRTFPAVQVTHSGSHCVERRLVHHAWAKEFVLSDGRGRVLLLVFVIQTDAHEFVCIVRKRIGMIGV